MSVKVVAFDILQTLFSLDTLRPRLRDAGFPSSALELWFTRIQRDGFAITAAGDFKPFPKIANASLQVLFSEFNLPSSEKTIQGILDGFFELIPQDDVESSLKTLNDNGIKMVALTNGSKAATSAIFKNAYLDSYIDMIINIDEV